MQRINITPRQNWEQRVQEQGFWFHTLDGTYWDESAAYQFEPEEIDKLELATNQLWEMCCEAAAYIVDKDLLGRLHIPKHLHDYVKASWEEEDAAIYGRFDLCYGGYGQPKMLEFNADTPTSLYEASVIQWYWLQDWGKDFDQFNSIHEALIEYWGYLRAHIHPQEMLYFACLRDNIEDYTTTEYLRDCAIQAGIKTKFLYMEDIGWKAEWERFVDMEDSVIRNIFKLYPWEWMANEEFGQYIPLNDTVWIEPAWKMLLSNKALLPILWELFPNSPYLLPAYADSPRGMSDYARKPILSREGANVELFKNNQALLKTKGSYSDQPVIYQQLAELPDFGSGFPVIGSWVVGQQSVGIGIRESDTLITDNTSRFVPHYF